MKKMKQVIMTLILAISFSATLTTKVVASEMTTDVGVEFTKSSEPPKPGKPKEKPILPGTSGDVAAPKQLIKLPQTGEGSTLKSQALGLSLLLGTSIVMFNRKKGGGTNEKTLSRD